MQVLDLIVMENHPISIHSRGGGGKLVGPVKVVMHSDKFFIVFGGGVLG